MCRALDGGKGTLMLYLDFSAVFDTLDHSALLNTLMTRFGVQGDALSRFPSFLTGRIPMRVKIDDCESRKAEMRHGVPTVHKKFGMPIAILAGDVLFSKAYQTISSTNLPSNRTIELVSRLAKACVDVCEGQLLDIGMAESKKIPNQSQYIKMIRKKTAALFDVSCAMGAICSKASKKDISNLSAFGDNLGIAFQITDDLIGVMGDPKVTKKPVGNDLREGKKSLPILLAINAGVSLHSTVCLPRYTSP